MERLTEIIGHHRTQVLTYRSSPEASLVAAFVDIIRNHTKFGIAKEFNVGSDTNQFADVEYLSKSGEYIVIEAKSNETQDAPNTVHKVFGQLLKECGKHRFRSEYLPVLAVLIPDDIPEDSKAPKEKGSVYYGRRFRDIPEDKYRAFGELVGIRYVFTCARNRYVHIYDWNSFRSGDLPFEVVSQPMVQDLFESDITE